MFDLKDKVALITGAASGIGFAYAKELLRNKLKAVALIDVHTVNGERAVNEITEEFGKNRAIFVKADVSDRKQFEDAFEATIKAFNQLDIVINNAGIIQEIQWEKCVAVNLIGVITGCMLAMEKYLPKYRSGPEAVILNTASVAGLLPMQGFSTYCATKYGVVGLTRSLGGEVRYQNTKVRVVAICPAIVTSTLIGVHKNVADERYSSVVFKDFKDLPRQNPEELATNAVNLIREAPTGSVWFAKDAQNCTQVEFPDYLS